VSPVHVLHVIDSLHGGGAETSLLEVIPELAGRGMRTSIVTVRPDDGALDGRLAALGVPRARLRRGDPVRAARELGRIIRAERPDVVHTTLLFAGLAGRAAGRAAGVPVVSTLANQDYGPEHRANSRYGAWSVRAVHAADLATAPLVTRFHAISRDVAAVMGRRLRIGPERIDVVYRGREPGRLGEPGAARRARVRAALGLGDHVPVVLSVGRFDHQKNIGTTIAAFRHVLARRPDAVLLVAGRPGNASAVVNGAADRVNQAAAGGGAPPVRLLGHRTDVPDLMCASDVLSFPSRWEGLGGTLIEAMALRLGIVASGIPPVAETIGEVGWPLVQPDDERALADGLLSVLEDGPLNKARKDAGQQRFRTRFTAAAAAEGMAAFYRGVVP
jgi:glycosyltransferase involved in cell wall biosynthesis